MMRTIFLLIIITMGLPAQSFAALWYVDNTASGTNAGTSWTNAWTSIAAINYTSVSAGDTIYISGGSTGKTYDESFALPKSGTVGNWITISTGQDAGHTGIVTFTCGGASHNGQWLPSGNLDYVHITGNVGSVSKMKVDCRGWVWHVNDGRTIGNVHLSYIDFNDLSYGFYFANGVVWTGTVEIDHNRIEKLNTAQDAFSDMVIYNLGGLDNTIPFDTHLVHHNTIYIPEQGSFGDDGMKWGSGWSFYDNTVVSVLSTYIDNQHADVFQVNLSHYKIYNNLFIDVGEKIFFHQNFNAPGLTHTGMHIYNNVFAITAAVNTVMRGISIGSAVSGVSFTDIVVANNTFTDWTKGVGLITLDTINGGVYSNCYVSNNLYKNSSGGGGNNIPGTCTVTTNSAFSSAVQFAAYTAFAAYTNDLHLLATDTVALDQGTDVSALIGSLDKDGVTRPVNSVWDIGAYEYGTPPVLDAITGFHAAAFTGSTWAVLIWPPYTAADFAGVNVYRCTATGPCSNRIAQITAASASAAHSPMTQWIDSKLYTADTYYYTVAPYNTSNVVGTMSSEASITVTGKQ